MATDYPDSSPKLRKLALSGATPTQDEDNNMVVGDIVHDIDTGNLWRCLDATAGAPVYAQLFSLADFPYTPGTPADWVVPLPTTTQAAIDRIASFLAATAVAPIP